MLSIQDINLTDQRVLIRVDFNVPIQSGVIQNDKRIRASLPTIQYCIDNKAKIMIMAHLGRPTEGVYDDAYSLAPVAKHLQTLLDMPVVLADNWIEGVTPCKESITLCENVRFLVGEKQNDTELATKMAALCDVFVMDAFGVSHRAQASTYGVAEKAPKACAGLLLENEVKSLEKSLSNPQRPLVAVVGGAKVSTKLLVLESLINKVDTLILGGGIANTFLAANGHQVANSLYEPALVDDAKRLMAAANDKGVNLPLATDVVVGDKLSEEANIRTITVNDLNENEAIYDIGPKTIELFTECIANASTILWNGPVGVFEIAPFANGTKALANAIADTQAFSIAGGGDTISAIDAFDISDRINVISTGGGAFLEFIEGKTLPAIQILNERAYDQTN